jgi:hypothetical protein
MAAREIRTAGPTWLAVALAAFAWADTALAEPCGENGYRRPYADDAPWNVPVAGLPRHERSERYVQLLWSEAPDRPGNFNLGFDTYTYPVYCAEDALDWYPIRTQWDTAIDGELIPWHPAWRPAPGTDAQVIILDPARGREWNLWQVAFDGATVHATNASLLPEDYRTYGGGNPPSRGIGIQYLAMLVRPEEIARGRIAHALSMPISNPDGTYYVAPATKLENNVDGARGIPEGMRFALDVSDAEIAAWLETLPPELPAATVRAAEIIAVALRDYGWFITDTAGGATFQFEANVTAGEEWRELGLGPMQVHDYEEYPRDLLDGLITPERLYAVVPSDRYPPSHARGLVAGGSGADALSHGPEETP